MVKHRVCRSQKQAARAVSGSNRALVLASDASMSQYVPCPLAEAAASTVNCNQKRIAQRLKAGSELRNQIS